MDILILVPPILAAAPVILICLYYCAASAIQVCFEVEKCGMTLVCVSHGVVCGDFTPTFIKNISKLSLTVYNSDLNDIVTLIFIVIATNKEICCMF